MDNSIICPAYKTEFSKQPITCKKRGFPFSGTEKEKSLFICQQILKKGKVSDNKIKRARIILRIIGGINILSPFFTYKKPSDCLKTILYARFIRVSDFEKNEILESQWLNFIF